jgi:SSS family solute:Na+ symporter/sodium/pantothenate symporter
MIMVVVALLIVGSGLHYLIGDGGGFLARLSAIDPNLAGTVNPASGLFDSVFKVYLAGFVIGFALVCQPHIMSKALYVKDDRAVRRYLGVTIVVTGIFMALLLVGFFVRLGPFPQDLAQDAVVTSYVTHTFSGPMLALISVALLAAGMSTLDGILVALSSIAANDLFLRVTEDNLLRNKSRDEQLAIAHKASQLILVVMGVGAFFIALHPPRLLGIFGQVGVYGLVAASTAPVLFGVFGRGSDQARLIAGGAVLGMGLHFCLFWWGGVDNPAVSATWGVLASVATVVVGEALLRCTKSILTESPREPSLVPLPSKPWRNQ